MQQHEEYRLIVQSHLGSRWLASLPVVDSATSTGSDGTPITDLTLRVLDQSELIGLLVDLHGRGLQILALDHLSEAGAVPVRWDEPSER